MLHLRTFDKMLLLFVGSILFTGTMVQVGSACDLCDCFQLMDPASSFMQNCGQHMSLIETMRKDCMDYSGRGEFSAFKHNMHLICNQKQQPFDDPPCDTTPLFPYGAEENDNRGPTNDEETVPICLSSPMTFFEVPYSVVYFCSNGLLGFISFCHWAFSQTSPFLGIAPFWSDADATNGDDGRMWYRETQDPLMLQRATSIVDSCFDDSCSAGFIAERLLIVTSHLLSAWGGNPNLKNTFQVVYISGAGGSELYVLFLYDRLDWMSGSGAVVGIGVGDQTVPYPPHTGPNSFQLLTDSNIGTDGVYLYKVSGPSVLSPQCDVLTDPAPPPPPPPPPLDTDGNNMFPFGPSAGDLDGPTSDDGTLQIQLSCWSMRFLGTDYSNVYMCANGIVGFLSYCSIWPTSADITGVVPLWQDNDVNNGEEGAMFYRVTQDAQLLQDATDIVLNNFDPACSTGFFADRLFILTYYRLRRFAQSSDNLNQNTYQIVFISGNSDTELYVLFIYDRIEWYGSTGVGIGDGSSPLLAYPPYSGFESILLLFDSNVGTDGMYLYKVSGPNIQDPQCNNLN